MKVRIEVANGQVINVAADVDIEVQIVDHDILDAGNYIIDDTEVDVSFFDVEASVLDDLTLHHSHRSYND
jgi:hypothetical protein